MYLGPFYFDTKEIFLFLVVNFLKLPTLHTPLFSIPRLPAEARYVNVSVIFQPDMFHRMVDNVFALIRLVFITQTDGREWNAIPQFGLTYFTGPVFLMAGLWISASSAIKKRHLRSHLIVFMWFLAAIITATLTEVNINRINSLLVPLAVYGALGLMSVYRYHKRLFAVIIALHIFLFSAFTQYYFTVYPGEIGPLFYQSYGSAIRYALNSSRSGPVNITDKVNESYIYVLFYGRLPPEHFFKTVVYEDPGAEFRTVLSFDRFAFGIHPDNLDKYSAFIFRNGEEEYFDPALYTIKRFHLFSVAHRKEGQMTFRSRNNPNEMK